MASEREYLQSILTNVGELIRASQAGGDLENAFNLFMDKSMLARVDDDLDTMLSAIEDEVKNG